MRLRVTTGIGAALAALLSIAPGAAASTEVGSGCAANATVASRTILPLATPGGPLPLTAPAAGVVTRWKVPLGPGAPGPEAVRLGLFRATGATNEFTAVDTSEAHVVYAGRETFGARIPVRPGDRFGLLGFRGTYVCAGEAGHVSGLLAGEPRSDQARVFRPQAELGTPVTAIVEPDADGDGYGDERQDKCPTSAAYHRDACSPVKLRVRTKSKQRSIVVRVGADLPVSVQVYGQVGWGFKAKGKRKSGHSKPTRLIVGLGGGTKRVGPGRTAVVRMALPRTVKRRLGRITTKESLKAEVTAAATDADGALAERRAIVKLRGWKKLRK